MNQKDLDEIETLIKKHKPSSTGFLTLLFILFLLGTFKGCGY